ncbi:MAG: SIS domain-containing protein [Lachnospiraceae bacterium]|nr:SIS domain-containing protein [Lachnospiraceae bacterium]
MKERTNQHIETFFGWHEDLVPLREEIIAAAEMIIDAYRQGGKVLTCGNGGSSSDCEHIVGELLKGFLLKRPMNGALAHRLENQYGEEGKDIAVKLQQGLPAICLSSQASIISAFANDVDPELVYAQQVLGYGKPGDVLIGISTSGNAKNVAAAVMMANALGMHTIGLTGKHGGKLGKLAELVLYMPKDETYRVQEDHLAIYHLVCIIVESELFES